MLRLFFKRLCRPLWRYVNRPVVGHQFYSAATGELCRITGKDKNSVLLYQCFEASAEPLLPGLQAAASIAVSRGRWYVFLETNGLNRVMTSYTAGPRNPT